jgi:hypothetical protein
MGDAERLELMGDPFSVVRLHADHGDVAEEIIEAEVSISDRPFRSYGSPGQA